MKKEGLVSIGVLASVLAVSVFMGVVLFGASGQRVFGQWPTSGGLDYSSRQPRFPALTSEFIERILGIDSGESKQASSNSRTGLESRRARGRTVLSHPLTNDDMADAISIESIPFVARTNTQAATRQPRDPSDCSPAGSTVWYRYAATSSRTLIAHTVGSSYAIALGVYEGTPTSLKLIGCNTGARGDAYVNVRPGAGDNLWFQITGPVGGGALVFSLEALGVTSRASVTFSGAAGDRASWYPSISGDGRYLAFASWASNIIPNDNNRRQRCARGLYPDCPSASDIFVRDLRNGVTERVSVSSSGEEGNDISQFPYISRDGRYVVFISFASNLVPGDTNGDEDVFIHDRLTRKTERISVSSIGGEGIKPSLTDNEYQWREGDGYFSGAAVVSADGRYVAFDSPLKGLDPRDQNGYRDVFLHDRVTRTTTLITRGYDGKLADLDTWVDAITPDGRFVLMTSLASNLVPGDDNGGPQDKALFSGVDVFLFDAVTRTTIRVSESPAGEDGNGFSEWGSISDDGRYVSFTSQASNFVEGDTSGTADVFVRDLVTGSISRIAPIGGDQQLESEPETVTGHGDNYSPSSINYVRTYLSGDGRFVVFSSRAPNLVPGDGNAARDVFLFDRKTSVLLRLSISASGVEGNGDSANPVISGDGRFVAFDSTASNFDSGDSNEWSDVYVHALPDLG